jgi:hypothetical protein
MCLEEFSVQNILLIMTIQKLQRHFKETMAISPRGGMDTELSKVHVNSSQVL